MFKKELEEKLIRIFGFKKTTFDAPSEAFEQDTLFIDVTEARTNPSQGIVNARVVGVLTVFSKNDSLTYGHFSKRIQQAKKDDKKDFFFYDVDVDVATSPARMQNITERRTSFVYLYSAQYDPNQGLITSLEIPEE